MTLQIRRDARIVPFFAQVCNLCVVLYRSLKLWSCEECLKSLIVLSKYQKTVVIPNEMRNRIKTVENMVSMRYLTFVRYDEIIVDFLLRRLPERGRVLRQTGLFINASLYRGQPLPFLGDSRFPSLGTVASLSREQSLFPDKDHS